ncbi:AbgT family transporter [Klebsiella variicola subsp. variicola]|nr:AbgT family transporter [Klebsiella variicola subsp. variicola]
MATSVIVLTLVGGLITDKLVEPRLGQRARQS